MKRLNSPDRVVVMSNGHIEQINTPAELYSHPNSRFVFDFLGNVNVFEASWQQKRWEMAAHFLTPSRTTNITARWRALCYAVTKLAVKQA